MMLKKKLYLKCVYMSCCFYREAAQFFLNHIPKKRS